MTQRTNRLRTAARQSRKTSMDKRDLALLERAFEAEVRGAILKCPRLMQTKATARADALVADGLLTNAAEMWGGARVEGYELTHAGRLLYCATCD